MKNKILIAIISATILLVAGFFTNWFGLFNPTGNIIVERTFEIPLSEITETSKFYEYESGTTNIRFFAVKAFEGTIKVGFDACDVCHDSKKGYRQEGDNMICNNCGNKYPLIGLGTENKKAGGCWPGYLPSEIDGENIIIQKSDIEEGKWRFQ